MKHKSPGSISLKTETKDYSQRKFAYKNFIIRYGTIIGLIVITILLALTTPSFMTVINIKNLLTQTAVLGIVAVGLTFVSIPGEMDVSMGSIVVLAGVFSVSMMTQGYGLIMAIGVGLLIGILAGLFNGFITIYGHVSSLIVTLTVGAILDGVSLLYTGGYRLYKGILPSYRFIGIGEFAGIPIPVIIMLVIVSIAYLLAHRTAFGRKLYAIGGNIDAAKLVGINPKLLTMIAFMIGSFTAAIAGVIVTARIGTAEPFVRFGYVLDAFAVVFLGTTIGEEGEPNIPGTLLGIIILGVLSNGMTLLGAPFFAQNILKGVLVLTSVMVGSLLRHQQK